MQPGDRLWTKAEEGELAKWFPLVGAAEMSLRLNRGMPAIRTRAAKVGLKSCRFTAMRQNWKVLLDNPYLSLTDVQRSYIAGIVDGEGYINWARRTCCRVGIANTNKELIDWLEKTVFGSVVYDHKMTNPNWKQDWRWTLEGSVKSRAFLMVMYPFLIVKRENGMRRDVAF